MNSPVAGAGTWPALVAAARDHRASRRRVALLSVRFIAERTRTVLPEAASVGLRWSADGSWLQLAGFFSADGTEISGEAVRDRLEQLENDLTPAPVTNLDTDNESTWQPFATDTAPDGFLLDCEYRLIIDKALTAIDPARPCGCPDTGRTCVGGVEITCHEPGCPGGEPRTYAWMDDGRLVTGTLADYARAFALAADESLPAGEISTEVRTWDAGYHVRAQALAAVPDDDGCWTVRLSVPGEQVTVRVWALTCPWPLAPGVRLPAGWPAPEPGPAYEGHVVYADGSRVSLQCYDGEHWRCPDVLPPGQERERGPLDGYDCECSGCPAHEPGARIRPVSFRFFDATVGWVPSDADMPGSDSYSLDAFGVEIILRRRQGATYLHVDTLHTREAPLRPLEIEVDNGGETAYR